MGSLHVQAVRAFDKIGAVHVNRCVGILEFMQAQIHFLHIVEVVDVQRIRRNDTLGQRVLLVEQDSVEL